ncbi:hypothetical protein BDD12DRAFT_901557 [Trichophaea hybrida]|nr:hypothetical protein BDD12DRAFT_901557 [Trichophaea hybrida]
MLEVKREMLWQFTFRGENVVTRDVGRKVLQWVDKFKEIGDIIVQYHPGHAALPWAGFRFLLKVKFRHDATNPCSMQERLMDTEEEKESLCKMNDLQYKGDIQDYLVRMETLNYHVCLSGIAWQEALHIGLNENIKD